MNKNETRRYAHKLAADAVESFVWDSTSPDAPRIISALHGIIEQHRRFGPKSSDRPPRPAPVKYTTPLLDTIETEAPC